MLKRSLLKNGTAVLAAAGLGGLLAVSICASAADAAAHVGAQAVAQTAAQAVAPAAAPSGVDVWVSVGAATGTPGVVAGVPVSWGNHGPEAAGKVVLTYTPPKGTTLAAPLPQGWTATVAGGATWTAASLPAGGKGRSAALPVRISVKAAVGKLTGGKATIGLGLVQAHTDRAPGNDTAASTVTVKPVPTPTPTPSPSRTPRPTPTPSASHSVTPTPTPSPTASTTASPAPSPTQPPTSSHSARPTPTRSAVALPLPGGPTADGPTPTGSDATVVALPTPHAGAPELDVVSAVLVPFGVVGVGCFLWMRRRLSD